MDKKPTISIEKIENVISNLRGLFNILESSNQQTEYLKNSTNLLKHSIMQLDLHKRKVKMDSE